MYIPIDYFLLDKLTDIIFKCSPDVCNIGKIISYFVIKVIYSAAVQICYHLLTLIVHILSYKHMLQELQNNTAIYI